MDLTRSFQALSFACLQVNVSSVNSILKRIYREFFALEKAVDSHALKVHARFLAKELNTILVKIDAKAARANFSLYELEDWQSHRGGRAIFSRLRSLAVIEHLLMRDMDVLYRFASEESAKLPDAFAFEPLSTANSLWWRWVGKAASFFCCSLRTTVYRQSIQTSPDDFLPILSRMTNRHNQRSHLFLLRYNAEIWLLHDLDIDHFLEQYDLFTRGLCRVENIVLNGRTSQKVLHNLIFFSKKYNREHDLLIPRLRGIIWCMEHELDFLIAHWLYINQKDDDVTEELTQFESVLIHLGELSALYRKMLWHDSHGSSDSDLLSSLFQRNLQRGNFLDEKHHHLISWLASPKANCLRAWQGYPRFQRQLSNIWRTTMPFAGVGSSSSQSMPGFHVPVGV